MCQTPTLCTWPRVLSAEEATARWNECEQGEKAGTCAVASTWQDNELYCRVPIKMRLDFFKRDERINRASLTASSDKKVAEDKISNAMSKIDMHLDKFGGMEVNGEDNAMAALARSAGNPLLGGADISASVRDIRNLLPAQHDSDGDDDDEDDDGGDDPANGEGEPKPSKSTKKPGAWWPREAFVVKKEAEIEAVVAKDENIQRQFRVIGQRSYGGMC